MALGVLAAGCAIHSRVGADTVGPGYVTGGGEWNTGGGIWAVERIFERDGKTVVCGAWTTDRQSTASVEYNDDVMEAASVYAGRTRLVQNLRFMTRQRYSGNLSGASAACVASGEPWRAEFAESGPRFGFPTVSVPEDIAEDGSGTSGRVTFRQRPRPSIVR